MNKAWMMVGCLALLAASAIAEPINRFCPIGKEAIQASAGTITYMGREIGFCCPGCDEEFLEWDDKAKSEFVLLAMAHKEPQKEAAPTEPLAAKPDLMSIHPYTLGVCPISGEALGDDAETRDYDGREVSFCCKDCAGKYEAAPAEYNAKIDEQVAARQRIGYPMTTCPLSGESMFEDGKFTGVEVVHNNRLLRVCCKNCAAKAAANPEAVFAKLDAAIVASQTAMYPIKTCPISGEAFEADMKPINLIYENRLYRLCCKSCVGEFVKTPAKYAAALDAAYAEAQRAALTTCPLSGEALDDSAVEIVAGTRLFRFCCDKCAAKFKADPDKYTVSN